MCCSPDRSESILLKKNSFPDRKKRPKKLFLYLWKNIVFNKILERIAGNSFTKIGLIEVLKKYFVVFIGLFDYKFYFCLEFKKSGEHVHICSVFRLFSFLDHFNYWFLVNDFLSSLRILLDRWCVI